MSDEKEDPAATDPLAEVRAMGDIAKAIADLDSAATARVLLWAIDRYDVAQHFGVDIRRPLRPKQPGAGGEGPGNGNGGAASGQFTELADLYAAAAPEMDTDKALVAGYWFQFCEGKPEFGSQEINTALKNLGHPINNITSAFDNLKGRKPAPVMQLKKSGTSKQARKTFKLTVAGKSAVEMMIGQHN